MAFEDPLELLRRLKLSREEYCQRLLTMLIVGGPYPRWSTRSALSGSGARFLQDLDVLCFGSSDWRAAPVFVDEFDLPRRYDGEAGAAPDYAVLWGDRVWMIELKTEASSHRPAQLPAYLELAGHHYRGCRIDLCYLTPPMPTQSPALEAGARFAHVSWTDIIPLLHAAWDGATAAEHRVLEALLAGIDSIGRSWTAWRTGRLGEPAEPSAATEEAPQAFDAVDEAIGLAGLTAADGRQRALDRPVGHLEELQALRLDVRQAITGSSDERLRHVMPWIWNTTSSGAKPSPPPAGTPGTSYASLATAPRRTEPPRRPLSPHRLPTRSAKPSRRDVLPPAITALTCTDVILGKHTVHAAAACRSSRSARVDPIHPNMVHAFMMAAAERPRP